MPYFMFGLGGNRRRRMIMKSSGLDVEKILYRFIFGSILGFFLSNRLFPSLYSRSLCTKSTSHVLPWDTARYLHKESVEHKESSAEKGSIYIGMMSMESKMNTRVEAAINTWAKNPNVKVEIFANNQGLFDLKQRHKESFLSNGIRVIQLPGVSDHVYPPQKKSFSMIKFMHDMYINDYNWFVRLDDDSYIDVEKLQLLLNKANASKPLYIGHAGFGRDKDDYIGEDDNYCMGGTGMVFSNALLRQLAPKLKDCLGNLYTEHEDIELGRCVKKTTGVSCTMAWESTTSFFQNFQQGSYAPNIMEPKELDMERGIIFHANKEPQYQYNFHVMMLKRKVKTLISKVARLEKEIRCDYAANATLDNWAANSYSQFRWDAIVGSNSYKTTERSLKTKMHSTIRNKLVKNTNTFLRTIQSDKRNKYKRLKAASLDLTYYIVNPQFSFDALSEISLTYSSKALVQQHHSHPERVRILQRQYFSSGIQFFRESAPLTFPELETPAQSDSNTKDVDLKQVTTSKKVPINFLMALSGRPDNFIRFINNFEDTFLKLGETVNLMVVFFPKDETSNDSNSEDPDKLIVDADALRQKGDNFEQNEGEPLNDDIQFFRENMNSLKQNYPESLIKLILVKPGTEFSRGVGLQMASDHVTNDDEILFFCDVDLVFKRDILTHIRRNTVQGKQVYYPVFFSQYDPDVVYVERQRPATHFNFEELDGFWRFFSYGMLSIYKSDFTKTNGFDLKIHGWGLEDIEMVKSIQKISLDVFQSPEPAEVHVYHDKFCDPSTTAKQYHDCMNSRASHYGPKSLLYYIYKAPEINGEAPEKNLALS